MKKDNKTPSPTGEDIFNFKLRTNNDVIKYPKNFGLDSQIIEKKITEHGQKNHQQFTKYMQIQYAIFYQKINLCKLKCVENAKDYNDIKNGYANCEAGIKTFRRFVDQKIGQMHTLLNECVSNATQLPNSLNQTYYCYQLYNKGFDHLKSIIREESFYYQ